MGTGFVRSINLTFYWLTEPNQDNGKLYAAAHSFVRIRSFRLIIQLYAFHLFLIGHSYLDHVN